ncbi:MAG: phage capsid protein, partial [Pseudomonadota bacterium]
EFDRDIGMRGGEVVRVGESVKEVIAESSLGYFFQNAVA